MSKENSETVNSFRRKKVLCAVNNYSTISISPHTATHYIESASNPLIKQKSVGKWDQSSSYHTCTDRLP